MSKSLQEIDKSLIWHPFTPLEGGIGPLVVTKGEGAYLYTEDGRKILDAVSSWWVNIHGHAQPDIARAIADQAMKLEQVIFAGFTHEPAVRVAESLLSLFPDKFSKVFYSDDGSTSVEVAIKLALQYWHNLGTPKKRLIAIEGAYHGDTFGAMAVGDRGGFTAPFGSLLFDVDFIPFPTEQNKLQVFDRLNELTATGEVAAFIFEPLVQGAGGMNMYSTAILDELMSIADEVMTGFGRTGTVFATDQTSRKPDLMCMSKGITGGFLPLGVTAVADFIVKAFATAELSKTFFHGHSFTANPLACAAAVASMKLLLDEWCLQQRQMIEKSHRAFAEKISSDARVKDVRVTGTILALEINTGDTSYFNDIRTKVMPFFLERDILLRPLGNVVYVLPPYVINEQELESVYNAMEEFLRS
jgi:adenosylmethionine---8-amino-7-oxononanoate aminotransferase